MTSSSVFAPATAGIRAGANNRAPGANGNREPPLTSVRATSMSLRGGFDDKLHVILRRMMKFDQYVVCVQETWMNGSQTLHKSFMGKTFVIILVNEFDQTTPVGAFRRGGVGIILSPQAARDWDGKTHQFGKRLVSARFHVEGAAITFASGWAPNSSNSTAMRVEFREEMENLQRFVHAEGHLFFGIDGNCKAILPN